MSQTCDTPETEAMFYAWNMRTSSIGVEEPSDFARRMEKERNAAREDARRLAKCLADVDDLQEHEILALAAHEALTAKK